MNTPIITEHYIFTADPQVQFPQATLINLYKACGALLPWAVFYFRNTETAPTLKDHMEELYGSRDLFPMKGLTLHEDGHLSYPGDPDMYPLVSIEQPTPTDPPLRVLIYPHAIIAFIENGQTFITRMD